VREGGGEGGWGLGKRFLFASHHRTHII
jgi:hypothetical protein